MEERLISKKEAAELYLYSDKKVSEYEAVLKLAQRERLLNLKRLQRAMCGHYRHARMYMALKYRAKGMNSNQIAKKVNATQQTIVARIKKGKEFIFKIYSDL